MAIFFLVTEINSSVVLIIIYVVAISAVKLTKALSYAAYEDRKLALFAKTWRRYLPQKSISQAADAPRTAVVKLIVNPAPLSFDKLNYQSYLASEDIIYQPIELKLL